MKLLTFLLAALAALAAASTYAADVAPNAQMPANETAQVRAEAKHLAKTHGNVNDSADKRLDLAHPQH